MPASDVTTGQADSDELFPFESAARLMTTNIVVVEPTATVSDVRGKLMDRRYDSVSDIAVCDGTSLKGLLRIEDVLAAPPHTPVTEIMDTDPPLVAHGLDQQIVAWKAVEHGDVALAVVDDDDRFLGLIPPQRLLGVLLEEHHEDMARLGGFLKGTSTARAASMEPVHQRLWHRLPWLLVGLLGAMAAALIVDGFEGRLREEVVLAFFIPGVVYLADAVGTQTEALIIRGLSVGVTIREVVTRELLTGVLAGAALGAAFLPFGVLVWDETDVAITVSIALFASCTLATAIAMALPWLFSVLRRDPAFGSGPLATVIQDLLSIVVYFAVASVIVG
jgi:magnesium transporter